MKLTIPKAILIGSIFISVTILLKDDGISFFTEARADVGGKDYRALRRDRDFKKAVKYIVETCNVNVSINGGYVDGDYLYGANAVGNVSC